MRVVLKGRPLTFKGSDLLKILAECIFQKMTELENTVSFTDTSFDLSWFSGHAGGVGANVRALLELCSNAAYDLHHDTHEHIQDRDVRHEHENEENSGHDPGLRLHLVGQMQFENVEME